MIGIHGGLTVHEDIVGIEFDAPHLFEPVAGTAFLHDELEHRLLCRKPYRLVKCAIDFSRLAGRLPLAVNTAEAARPGNIASVGVDDLEQVFAAVCLVVRLRHVPGPGQGFDDDLVERKHFHLMVAAVNVVDAHRGGHLRHRARVRDQNKKHCHEFVH